MKYYMKSKIFKLKEDFWITDENGKEVFLVDNKLISIGLQFNIQKDNNILYEIKQKLSLTPKYEVIKGSDVVASINKKITFVKDKIKVDSSYGELLIHGNLFDRNYNIYKDDNIIATVKKEAFSLTDNYSIDIDFEDEAFILSLVVIIDDIRDEH
ncbi:Uncharacterized protein YxjI [Terrisporobacter glycolicus]|nr:Uncharacterized protein YxjI [Terrisporobacter glycolicus]